MWIPSALKCWKSTISTIFHNQQFRFFLKNLKTKTDNRAMNAIFLSTRNILLIDKHSFGVGGDWVDGSLKDHLVYLHLDRF